MECDTKNNIKHEDYLCRTQLKGIGGGVEGSGPHIFRFLANILANLMYFQMQLRDFPEMTPFCQKLTLREAR